MKVHMPDWPGWTYSRACSRTCSGIAAAVEHLHNTYNRYRIAAQTAAGLTLAAALLATTAAACVNSPAYEQSQQQNPTLPAQPQAQTPQLTTTPGSPTPTPAPQPTPTPTPAPLPPLTPAASLEATIAATPTPRKPEDTPTPTPTATATAYPTATPTATAVPPTPTPTSTPMPTATATPRPPTPTPTPTPKPAPTIDLELSWIINAYDKAGATLPVQGREWRIEGTISVTQAAPNAKTSTQIPPVTVIAYLDNDVKNAAATTVTLPGIGAHSFSIAMPPVYAAKSQPSTASSSGIEKLVTVAVNPDPTLLAGIAALASHKSIPEQVNETNYGNNTQTVKVRFAQAMPTPTPVRSGGGGSGGSGGSYGTPQQPPSSQPRPPPPSGSGPGL